MRPLASVLVAGLAAPALAAASLLGLASLSPARDPGPAAVLVEPGEFMHRPSGEHLRDGRPVSPELERRAMPRTLGVMKAQVTVAEYARCVADGACRRAGGPAGPRSENHPVTGVSWQDARAYAAWLSARTGRVWRLPTDAEWAFAAGARFKDDAVLADDGEGASPGRWLARYAQEAARPAELSEAATRPVGSFGANERGLLDLGGNVWEWTDTCYTRRRARAPGRRGDGELRRPRRRRRPSQLHDELHPRSARRRLRRRASARQSRLPLGAGGGRSARPDGRTHPDAVRGQGMRKPVRSLAADKQPGARVM